MLDELSAACRVLHAGVAIGKLVELLKQFGVPFGQVTWVVALEVADVAVNLLLLEKPLDRLGCVMHHTDVQGRLTVTVHVVDVCTSVNELPCHHQVFFHESVHQNCELVAVLLVQVVGSGSQEVDDLLQVVLRSVHEGSEASAVFDPHVNVEVANVFEDFCFFFANCEEDRRRVFRKVVVRIVSLSTFL